MSGFSLDPADLALAARGIETVIGELSSMGVDALAGGQQGRGFDQLSMTGMQLGSGSLRDVLDDYCNRWQWGVRALVHDAQSIARALDLSAGTNLAIDQHVGDSLKVLGASFRWRGHHQGISDLMTGPLPPAEMTARLRQLMSDVPALRPKDVESVESAIEGGEWLLAFEILCTQIYEWEISLTASQVRELEQLGARVGASPRFTDSLWEDSTDA